MSSSDQDTKLAYWLPKLEVYRAAIEASPEVENSTPKASELIADSVLSQVSLVGRICQMRPSEERDAVSVKTELAEADESTCVAKPTIASETIVAESIELGTTESVEDEVASVEEMAAEGLAEEVVSLPEAEHPEPEEQPVDLPVEKAEADKPIEVIPHVPALAVYVGEESTLQSHGSESRSTLSHGSESRAALPQVLHLPIDGILKKIKGLKPFVLGIGTVGKSETQWSRHVVRDAVNRCCDKTGRNAILVSVRPSGDSDSSENASHSDAFREVGWTYFGDSKAETKAWHTQLADLPKWKKEFGLIVFDLGDVRLPTMPRIGRLCDGIVVQLLNAANSRDTIQALKGLQKDRLKILGVWSVELNARSNAA